MNDTEADFSATLPAAWWFTEPPEDLWTDVALPRSTAAGPTTARPARPRPTLAAGWQRWWPRWAQLRWAAPRSP
ncbi:MAG: hypothetical protein IIZ92_27810 [Aquincola sp.]|nr:hypothetical protein [Aquincola sp.]